MKKIVTIVGTRPEIVKLSRVIAELDKHCEHILVHTGQNYDYELSQVFFDDLEIREPNYFLEAAEKNVASTIGQIIMRVDEVLEKTKPDAVLVYGDTNSCLSVIAAKRRRIPIFHMEAGNRCFDARVPEEINRKIVDHTSDINMTLTEHARRYLIQEGVRPETIIKVGSSMKEVLQYYSEKIAKSQVLKTLEVDEKAYFLVSAHREENLDSEENFANLLDTLNAISEKYSLPVLVSTHPRTQKRLDDYSGAECNERVRFLKPLGFCDYIALQKSAYCVISDSGTITEEASILNLTAITIRQAHERPEGMDEGVLIMSGLKPADVLNAIDIVVAQSATGMTRLIDDYDAHNVSKKVVRIIHSYIDYVKRTVWHEN